MRPILLKVLFLLTFIGLLNFSHSQTAFNQMKMVNAYWDMFGQNIPGMDSTIQFSNDNERIQHHLFLVTKTLRNAESKHLSESQIYLRNQLLDNLEEYAKNGVFPKNIRITQRTPHFIDHRQIPCAVGYMLIQSGQNSLVQKIHSENNLGYISDLARQYSEIEKWADHFGFTLEELAWIQPGYPFEPTTCDTVCYEGLQPFVYGYDNNKQFQYVWMEKDAGVISRDRLSPKICSGDSVYVIVHQGKDTFPEEIILLTFSNGLIGSVGDNNKLFLPDADKLKYVLQLNDDRGNCSGSVEVKVTDKYQPYNLRVMASPREKPLSRLTELCHGKYLFGIMDSRGCTYTEDIYIDSNYIEKQAFWIKQTTPGVLEIDLDKKYWPNTSMVLIHPNGVMQNVAVTKAQTTTLTGIKPGIYSLQLTSDKHAATRRFFVY